MMQKVGAKFIREKGWLYYICKKGYVYRFRIKKPHIKQRLTTNHINKERGYLYYINKHGFVDRTKIHK
jgi:hypothetical protein